MESLASSLAAFPRIDVRANGLRFAVRTAGTGERLALCLHGFPEAWFSWRHQLPMLASLGYRAWAPDLRGYGDSERPRGLAPYAVDRLVEDVAGLIDASGSRDVTLIGHDWGGMIAWWFAMRKVRPLSRFVAMNIPHPERLAHALSRPGPQWRRSSYMALFQLPWFAERTLARGGHRAIRRAFSSMAIDKSRFPDELLELYAAQARTPGALSAMLAYYRAAVWHRPDPRGWPRIETPTLVVWGEDDTALGKELLIGTERHGTDLTVRRVPRCSHWVQQEKPDEVNALLTSWLTASR
jgi:pimeloyl-ACP methyl ester carboxylesterase